MTNPFDLKQQMGCFDSQAVPAGEHPIIGITGNYGDLSCKLAQGYYKQVEAAGGVPLIIPPSADSQTLLSTLEAIDGLLLSGGADINPLYCGEEPLPALGGINDERDLPELLITRLAYRRQLPILGICRGIQTLAVALGGTVHQDIGGIATVKHSQEADRHVATHSVDIDEHSLLYNIYKDSGSKFFTHHASLSSLFVNSFHHQAVHEPGPHLRVTARAKDGIVEAVESTEHKPVMGVQWHPECLGDNGLPLFLWLVDEARQFRNVKTLHRNIITLDTHCDTPMFFPQGIDFAQRDERILVDLHKMTEGRLDATIMVAYLPQDFTKAPTTLSPRAYADDIFDKIESIAAHNSQYLALARTPDDLLLNKRQGKKSIMLGIENGLALEGDIRNLQHFADRGIVYITLCHNGDNDICDSAKGSQTHGGVSDFGRQVIGEMNRLGVMVDLSHAAESSFYDALSISTKPIVCSHSSARALCDHPRNLTDDQMRALAQKGGVCQITLYPGFLKSQTSNLKPQISPQISPLTSHLSPLTSQITTATILDAMAHLDHAISVMGIDHVGLGTDFDGDGGVPGLADASELPNFTRQLLARRYSEEDIQKIWGGNFLRVMRQVQAR